MMLDEQYRIVPACSRFPRAQFYDGKGLEDSETVLQDNAGWKSDPQVHEGDQCSG